MSYSQVESATKTVSTKLKKLDKANCTLLTTFESLWYLGIIEVIPFYLIQNVDFLK